MKHLTALLGLCFSLSAASGITGAQQFDLVSEWSCRATGVYGLKVDPQGKSEPTVKSVSPPTLNIRIQPELPRTNLVAGEQWISEAREDLKLRVAIDGESEQLMLFKGVWAGQGVVFSSSARVRDWLQNAMNFDVTYRTPESRLVRQVLLSKNGDFWQFMLSSSGLMTEADAKGMSIMTGRDFAGGAESIFFTGPCVRSR